MPIHQYHTRTNYDAQSLKARSCACHRDVSLSLSLSLFVIQLARGEGCRSISQEQETRDAH